jgi:hypothetical protein
MSASNPQLDNVGFRLLETVELLNSNGCILEAPQQRDWTERPSSAERRIGDVENVILSGILNFDRPNTQDRRLNFRQHTRLAPALRAEITGASFSPQIKGLKCCKTASSATPAEGALGRRVSHPASAFSVTA